MKAIDFLKEKETYDSEYPTISLNDAEEAMIEFAKHHVELALKTASDEAKIFLAEDWIRKREIIYPGMLIDSVEIKVYTPSILNSYSLENIK